MLAIMHACSYKASCVFCFHAGGSNKAACMQTVRVYPSMLNYLGAV